MTYPLIIKRAMGDYYLPHGNTTRIYVGPVIAENIAKFADRGAIDLVGTEHIYVNGDVHMLTVDFDAQTVKVNN